MEVEQLYKWVKDHAEEIKAGAASGDYICRNIITTYQMLVVFPEHCALAILGASVDEYIERENKQRNSAG
jgi:hypothetical protein